MLVALKSLCRKKGKNLGEQGAGAGRRGVPLRATRRLCRGGGSSIARAVSRHQRLGTAHGLGVGAGWGAFLRLLAARAMIPERPVLCNEGPIVGPAGSPVRFASILRS